MLLIHPESLELCECRIEVSNDGLMMRRTNGSRASRLDQRSRSKGSATKIPWWSIRGFLADETERAPDGAVLQVVEVVTDAGSLYLAVPAYQVSEIFSDVSHYASKWDRARGVLRVSLARRVALISGALVPLWAMASARSRSTRLFRVLERAVTPALIAVVTAAIWIRARVVAATVVAARILDSAWGIMAAINRLALGYLAPGISAARDWSIAALRLVWILTSVLLAPVGAVLKKLATPVLRWASKTVVGMTVISLARRASIRLSSWKASRQSEWPRRRAISNLATAMSVVMIAGAVTAFVVAKPVVSHRPRAEAAVSRSGALSGLNGASIAKMISELDRGHRINLPPATKPPAPAPPSLADAPPLSSHEVFGFAPYWLLPSSNGFNVNALTTLAYFSIGVNANGTLNESGSGWNGYESQALADLITRAHQAGDRVVLTVNCFSQSALDQLTSSSSAPGTLASALISAVEAKNLDGVNIDFEGQGSSDQNGLTNLIAQVSTALHNANPHWQVTMDTYASSAGDPNGFYNIGALTPYVDAFFVMAYQLNLQATPQSTSPLTSSMFSDLTTASQYAAVVPASKVIFGVPFYGYSWPTTNGTLSAQATGAATPVTYGQIIASGNPIYWDPVTDTAWTSYQTNGQWYEDFFEDPSSLYLVTQLAQFFHFGGMGVWTLGMDGGDPMMLGAVDGFAPPAKSTNPGPTTTTSTTTTSTTTTTSPISGVSPSTTTTTGPTTTTTSSSTTTSSPGSTTTTTPPTTTTSGTGTSGSGGTGGSSTTTTTQSSSVRQQARRDGVARLGASTVTGRSLYEGTATGVSSTDPLLSCLDLARTLEQWSFEIRTQQSHYVAVADRRPNCVNAYLILRSRS